jgi:hypothetical protein
LYNFYKKQREKHPFFTRKNTPSNTVFSPYHNCQWFANFVPSIKTLVDYPEKAPQY